MEEQSLGDPKVGLVVDVEEEPAWVAEPLELALVEDARLQSDDRVAHRVTPTEGELERTGVCGLVVGEQRLQPVADLWHDETI
jgi:hypothetical protein